MVEPRLRTKKVSETAFSFYAAHRLDRLPYDDVCPSSLIMFRLSLSAALLFPLLHSGPLKCVAALSYRWRSFAYVKGLCMAPV